MLREEIYKIKRLSKVIGSFSFKPLKKNQLPEPWKRMGGTRIKATPLLEAGNDLVVIFITRDGETVDRKLFMGFLCKRVSAGYESLYILHYHPSHKGIHAQFNCESDLNYVNRQLPQAKEFSLTTPNDLDPVEDAYQIAGIFCQRMGIQIKPQGEDLLQ